MAKIIETITTQRQHLFDVSHNICEAVPLELLKDPKNPVVISVRGTYGDGKKIIPDAAIEKLFGVPDTYNTVENFSSGNITFEGKKFYDEYWTGEYKGTKLQITFMNVALGFACKHHKAISEERPDTCDYNHKRALNFIPLREYGGVSFIHNCESLAKNEAWVDIWIEKKYGRDVGLDQHHPEKDAHAANIFENLTQAAANDNGRDWTRYLRINVRRPELLDSPTFMTAIQKLKQPDFIFKPR